MHRQDPPGHPSHPQLPQGQFTTRPRLGQSQPLPIHPQLRRLPSNSRLRPLPPHHKAPPTLHVSIHTLHTRHSLRHTCHQVGLGRNQAASLRQQLAILSMRSASTAQHAQCINPTKLTTSSHQLGPQHAAQQASVKRSQHPAAAATPHSISAQPIGTKHAAPCIVSGAEQRGATQAHPLPLPFWHSSRPCSQPESEALATEIHSPSLICTKQTPANSFSKHARLSHHCLPS